MNRIVVSLAVTAALSSCKGAEPAAGQGASTAAPDSRAPSGEPSARPTPSGYATSRPTSVTHGDAKSLKLKWTDPPGFERIPPASPIRAAAYRVPPAEGDKEPGDLGVFYFGDGKGGGAEKNIQRWVDSFGGEEKARPKKSERKGGGFVQHVVEIPDGTFASGMPGTPTVAKPGFALVGAVVQTPSGDYFFKLVGPRATVAKSREAFFGMLDSVKTK